MRPAGAGLIVSNAGARGSVICGREPRSRVGEGCPVRFVRCSLRQQRLQPICNPAVHGDGAERRVAPTQGEVKLPAKRGQSVEAPGNRQLALFRSRA